MGGKVVKRKAMDGERERYGGWGGVMLWLNLHFRFGEMKT